MKLEEIKLLFRNKADCYADTWKSDRGFMEEGKAIQAMTEDRFVEVIQAFSVQEIDAINGYKTGAVRRLLQELAAQCLFPCGTIKDLLTANKWIDKKLD